MQKRPGTRFNTYNALLSLSKQEDESLSSLAHRALQLRSDMLALRPMSYTLTNLDDELVLMALIRSLPPEYTPCCWTTPSAWTSCRTSLFRSKISLVRPHRLLPSPMPPLRSPARSVVAPTTQKTSAMQNAMPAQKRRSELPSGLRTAPIALGASRRPQRRLRAPLRPQSQLGLPL